MNGIIHPCTHPEDRCVLNLPLLFIFDGTDLLFCGSGVLMGDYISLIKRSSLVAILKPKYVWVLRVIQLPDLFLVFSVKIKCDLRPELNILAQVWCLIHNAHLEKILSFCKILGLKITHLKKFFLLIFLFNICHCNSGLALKSKSYYIAAQNCMYFIRENSQKLRQNCK
jgi:hypothetical protein